MTQPSPRSLELEQLLCGKWPDYREWLNEDRLKELILPDLERTVRHEAPFPHVFATGFLPQRFYDLLAEFWPPESAFRANKKRDKLDLVPREDPAYEFSAGFPGLPACVREAWLFFVQVVNRRIVGPWLARVFEAELQERVTTLQRLKASGRIGFEASGLEQGRVMANSGRLMMRGNGYTLAPHVDPAPYVVTVLHYFGIEEPDNGLGTRLYRAARPIDLDQFVADGTTQYFSEQRIPVEESVCLPFSANSLLAFPNRLDAAHGVIAPKRGYRKVFQYHLSLKGDHEPL